MFSKVAIHSIKHTHMKCLKHLWTLSIHHKLSPKCWKQKTRYIFYWCFLNLLSEATTQGISVILAASKKSINLCQMLSCSRHKTTGDPFGNARTVHSLTTWRPTTSTCHHSSTQPMEQMLNSNHFPKNVCCSILFYRSRTPGRSSHANQFLPWGIGRPLRETFSPPACTQLGPEISLNLSGFSAPLTSETKGHYSAAAHP